MFKYDSPFMKAMFYVGNLTLANVLYVVMCIPIVTIGASQTALYDVVFKIAEAGQAIGGVTVWRDFWAAFKRNFKQATALWGILLAFALVIAFNIYTVWRLNYGWLLKGIFILIAVLYLAISSYIFPLQARFDNKVFGTIKNAATLAIGYLPRTILMAVINGIPLFMALVSLQAFIQWSVLWLVIGCAGLALAVCFLLLGVFDKLMPEETEEE